MIENINLMNVAAKNTKVSLTFRVTKTTTEILDSLVDYNIAEYQLLNKKATVTLKYNNFKPTAKLISYMGAGHKNNITYNYAKRELNTKKSFYIVRTNLGIMTLESAVRCKVGCTLLFKINI